MTQDETTAIHGPSDQVQPLEILLEDGPLIALNKPAGLLTQGVPHAQLTLEGQVKAALKVRMGKPGNVYLGVPHRLDRPVSGVIVFAKNSKAAARLAEQFRERTVRKTYLAVVDCVTGPDQGLLEDWLLKDAVAAHVTVVPAGTEGAKRATLTYRVVAVHQGRSLVQIELHTGRMHQIRVQFASRGWPIVGDQQYAANQVPKAGETDELRFAQIALHAWRLELKHPIRYDDLRLEAPLPCHWEQYGFALPKLT